jgi:hypothetical protein
LDSQHFNGGAPEFEFELPPCEDDNETGPAVDLGDIVLQAQFAPSTVKSRVAVDGNYDTPLRATDVDGKTLNAVTATITHLEVHAAESGTRNFYPGGFTGVTPGKDGLLHLRVPAIYRARNDGTEQAGMTWDITHAEVKLECPGYETLTVVVAAGSRGTVVAMKPLAFCSVRVTLEGKPVARRDLQVEAGWQPYMDGSDFAKWKEDVATRTITRSSVPPGRWQVQAAHLARDGWRWFSEARETEIDVAGGGVVELPLRRGALLEGRIADDLLRPVRHGIARVLVLMPEPDNSKSTRIYWSDWQQLDEAGHFSFKGLPTGETWLAASCDGWISQQPVKKGFTPAPRVHYGESISMEWSSQPVIFNADLRDHVVLMTRTGSCVMRFVLEDGTPVKSASAWWDAGLTCGTSMHQNLNSMDRALDDLLRTHEDRGYTITAFLPGPAQATNSNGALQVLNLLPGIARFSMRIDNLSLQLADPAKLPSMHPHDLYAPFQVPIRPGETVRAEFVVRRVER